VISHKTVQTHVSHISAKLDVRTRTQAALLAQETRWRDRSELDVTA
jgi:DNA-binding NarL/FixJ family response regulator